ncbi:MAG: SEC-C domain-containing protein [Spirochaetales bacterium]|nr:SEC-C domain-containing protein [Spirochaetales bacterium]
MVRLSFKKEAEWGIRLLNKHNPQAALKHFRLALNECPVNRRRELDLILYYLGITLKRLGMSGSAVKSWSAGRNIYRSGHSTLMYRRHVNQYGMVKQSSEELDDWNAFYSIQLERYLSSKYSRKLGSEGERDMIWDLIYDNWVVLQQSGVLYGKTACEKWRIFNSQEIIFPFFHVPDHHSRQNIPVNFREKKKIQPSDPCPCNSGMPYFQCCGRTKSEEELFYGLF